MKKIFAVLAIVSLITSCKNKKDEGKKQNETTTTEPANTNPAKEESTTPGVPTFNDADVTAYVKAYEEYIATYKKAVESKDMTKMTDLAKLGQDLATKGVTATQKLVSSPEDAKKLADYMTAKSAEVIELSKKLTGQ